LSRSLSLFYAIVESKIEYDERYMFGWAVTRRPYGTPGGLLVTLTPRWSAGLANIAPTARSFRSRVSAARPGGTQNLQEREFENESRSSYHHGYRDS
jgi:hypothetical protein